MAGNGGVPSHDGQDTRPLLHPEGPRKVGMFRTKEIRFVFLAVALAVAAVRAQEPSKRVPRHYKVADVGYSGSVSPDGQFLAYVDGIVWKGAAEDHVFVLDLKTGQHRRLTTAGSGDAGVAAISPDGNQVAYEWINPDGVRELRIIGTDGSGDRLLYSNPYLSNWLDPMDWSPNGSHVLVILRLSVDTYQIALVSVANGSVRVVKTFDWYAQWGKMSFSPDGRYIVYDRPPEKGSSQRDIFVLRSDGGSEAALVVHPANDLFLAWTPDGTRIFFLSDRRGTWDTWAIGVDNGESPGPPTLVKPGLGPIESSLGFTRDGSYYYSRLGWVNDVYTAAFDPLTGKLRELRKLVSRVGFDTSVAWSPDGQYLAYAFGDGYPVVLGIHSVETSEERRFRLNMTRFGSHAVQPRWSPDGRFLLAQGRDLNFRQGLYRIDVENGRVAAIVQTDTYCAPDCVEWPVWSSDGRLFFIRWLGGAKSIAVRGPETGSEKELYRAISPARIAHLAVSPDSKWLAFFWRETEHGTAGLRVMPTQGGKARELVRLSPPELSNYGQSDFAMAWMPDSQHIIYAPSTTGQRTLELWQVSVEGGEPERLGLKMNGVLPYGLSVHPRGSRIAFTAGTPPHQEVWVLENVLAQVEGTKASPPKE